MVERVLDRLGIPSLIDGFDAYSLVREADSE